MSDTQKSSTTAKGKESEGFTAAERAAMKDRARELKASGKKADNLAEVLAKIAEMPEADRVIAEGIHEAVTATAPSLSPKTWYGMPAYEKDGKVLCFFQAAQKFESRYATFGFSDPANVDEGSMWPTSYAITKWNPENKAAVIALVKKAVG